jgi:glutaconate CoA-transferase subunit B
VTSARPAQDDQVPERAVAATPPAYSDAELLAVMAARRLQDGMAVFAGVGLPLLAAVLARTSHAPGLQIVVEGGVLDPEMLPGRLPISTNEMRVAHRASMLMGITDTFLYAQRGYLDLGFIGGAQVDRFGNVNSSIIGPMDRPRVRLPGSGGGNDIASLCREVIVVTMHEPRRFVPRVDFVTSPGWLAGADSRRQAGLHFGGASGVITNLALLGFDPTERSMRVEALHPGVTLEQVRAATGFPLGVAPEVVRTQPPSPAELGLLRSLDPERRYLR